jgi:hypothetical protein
MSSKPSSEGVAELRELLGRLRLLGAEIFQIRSAVARLKPAEREFETLHRAITDKMASMDVASNGNTGWELRVVWFLSELDRQAPPFSTAARA